MRLEEGYEKLGGDLAEVLERLKKRERILRLIKKVPGDPSMQQLRDAMGQRDYEEAFRFAHNLKGVCANLGLEDLRSAASTLTECLRDGTPKEEPEPLMELLEGSYETAIRIMGQLEEDS